MSVPDVAAVLDGIDCADASAVAAAISAVIDDVPAADRDSFTAKVKLTAAKTATDAGERLRAVKIEPEAFDFTKPITEPDWLIRTLIERSTVNVCSGDTGAAKSIHWQDASARILRGESWLGRETTADRVLYIDEENPARVVHARLAALGVANEDRDRFRYFRRKGIRVGVDRWTQWLREECEDFRPDLVVIDTAMAALSAETNDNDAVVALYTSTLRPLAEDFNLAVVILHHERKPGAQEKRNAGFAMMGARQWAGQADVHMTLTAAGRYTPTPRDDGGWDTSKEFKFAVAKGRDGHDEREERTTVRGVKDDRDRLLSMAVEYGGKVEAETAELDAAEKVLRIFAAAPDQTWSRKGAAGAAGERNPSDPGGTFSRAWRELVDGGDLDGNGHMKRLTDQGRERIEALGLEIA
jgi:hypothetical protein